MRSRYLVTLILSLELYGNDEQNVIDNSMDYLGIEDYMEVKLVKGEAKKIKDD